MKNTMPTTTAVKPGVADPHQNARVASGLRARTALKAGLNFTKITYSSNHNQHGLKVRSDVKAGRIVLNHNQTIAAARHGRRG